MNNIKEQLMNTARAKGICAEGYEQMRRGDIDALVSYYVDNPDWCIERDYPTLDFLYEHFSDIEDKGVFVGKTFHGELLNEKQAYIFHDCKGTIKVGLNVEKAIIPMLYAANGCRLKIMGIGQTKRSRAEVPVYAFGKNDISAKDNAYVKFTRYNHVLL